LHRLDERDHVVALDVDVLDCLAEKFLLGRVPRRHYFVSWRECAQQTIPRRPTEYFQKLRRGEPEFYRAPRRRIGRTRKS
jgi:hypothetical protein